jgi:heme-degrading monooxygenase HmoA
MISRTWHGLVPIAHKNKFCEYLAQTGVKEAEAIPGNLGSYVQAVEQGEFCHLFLCTIWESWEDVILYAGSSPHIAITYPEDKRYDLISDPFVIHQEVYTSNSPFLLDG